MGLPESLLVQEGQVGPQTLFVNRTPSGALAQNLGPNHRPGAVVGVYRLERIVRLEAQIVETPLVVSVVETPLGEEAGGTTAPAASPPPNTQ